MRTPIPRFVDTPRAMAAAEFVFVWFALTCVFGHDATRDFRVQVARRRYLAERKRPRQVEMAA